jgi:NADH-quinone oxidoreductase subunit L
MSMLPFLLGLAVLLPLFSFWLILIVGRRLGHEGSAAATIATGAILGSFVLSVMAALIWFGEHPPTAEHHPVAHVDHGEDTHGDEAEAHAAPVHAETSHVAGAEHDADHDDAHAASPDPVTGDWYTLGTFGRLRLTIGYYIDSLTICMFCMVTLISSCIHVYAMGYMHEELHDVTDHEVSLSDGSHLTRRGRYHRFFQFLSLFCFSMLGLVVAGNIAMTFVFWELVGICSYFLIGFYVERKSASDAANKAFIVNRIGDFGMIIGLMIQIGRAHV